MHDEKQPRQQWLLGKIVELLPGSDGKIRGAKVKIGRTKNIIRRPVNRLYPIEGNVEEDTKGAELSGNVNASTEVAATSTGNLAATRIYVQPPPSVGSEARRGNNTVRKGTACDAGDESAIDDRKRRKRKAAILGALKIRNMNN